MSNSLLITETEKILNKSIKSIESPLQGADSSVLICSLDDSSEIVLKYGEEVHKDLAVINILNESAYKKIPKVLGDFVLEEKTCLITDKATGTLWEFCDNPDVYIEEVLVEIEKIHQVTSKYPGQPFYIDQGLKITWIDFLNRRYDGTEEYYKWNNVLKNQRVNTQLLKKGLEIVRSGIKSVSVPQTFSMLHMDLNDRNIFIDEQTKEITCVIDWTDSVFGDRLLDLARFRLLLTHFYPDSINTYWQFNKFAHEEKKLEEFYFLCICLDYVIWYSEGEDWDYLERHEEILSEVIREY
ncbi:aminoglycoside phosphotransferase family protein [Candidatus Dojkabacteria bacterium]|uniref:Aminoglycoside phosphotransferase family protein n=1 Tax=Candidatus Dojkabacteria bacterium TaxID=2099670 RepID=A0A955I934_9BACT|nr:aminoglycoside phosphotransferase family protein [Candidatus Dojkabacteria bacterium]